MYAFTWECAEDADGTLVLFAPGADKIEYELGSNDPVTGSVDGDTLRVVNVPTDIFVKLHRGEESTRWVALRPNTFNDFSLASVLFDKGI